MLVNISEHQIKIITELLYIASTATRMLEDSGVATETKEDSVLEVRTEDLKVLNDALDRLTDLGVAEGDVIECDVHLAARALTPLLTHNAFSHDPRPRHRRIQPLLLKPFEFPPISVRTTQGQHLDVYSLRRASDINGIEVSLNDHPLLNAVVAADTYIGQWLSAALEDPAVCKEMKSDIRRWIEIQDKALRYIGKGSTRSTRVTTGVPHAE